jgi:hypothetical protein
VFEYDELELQRWKNPRWALGLVALLRMRGERRPAQPGPRQISWAADVRVWWRWRRGAGAWPCFGCAGSDGSARGGVALACLHHRGPMALAGPWASRTCGPCGPMAPADPWPPRTHGPRGPMALTHPWPSRTCSTCSCCRPIPPAFQGAYGQRVGLLPHELLLAYDTLRQRQGPRGRGAGVQDHGQGVSAGSGVGLGAGQGCRRPGASLRALGAAAISKLGTAHAARLQPGASHPLRTAPCCAPLPLSPPPAPSRLHSAGIEVILDVVYNHTAELDDKHPYTISFRCGSLLTPLKLMCGHQRPCTELARWTLGTPSAA